MIRAIWFMLKVGLFVGVAVWVSDHSGYVNIDMAEYDTKIRINTGLFFLILLIAILTALFFYRIALAIMRTPYNVKQFMKNKRRENGYIALSQGLTAVAAGDTKIAVRCASRATRFLPSDKGLPLLLKAQAARLQGDEKTAREAFAELVKNKDTSFLGVRGLLQAALDANDHVQALDLANRAMTMHPKQPWILRLVYDLQIQNRDWDNARKTLDRADKIGAIAKDKAVSDRIAMLLLEASADLSEGLRAASLNKLKKAQKIAPAFVPTIERLAKMYIQNNQRGKAQRIVEKAWKAEDHPELARIWRDMFPEHKSGDPIALMNWMQKLLKMQPDSAESYMALARAAINQKLWGEAREYLKKAEDIKTGARLYKMYASLEELSGGDEAAAKDWFEKAAEAQPGKRWVCSQTGRIYQEWSPIAQPHGSFNTIEWTYPHGVDGNDSALLSAANDDEDAVLLEAPA